VSVAELVRTRCERRPTEEEAVLAALTVELNKAVVEAKTSLKNGLDEAQSVLAELRGKREVVTTSAVPARRRPKAAGAGA
jgi:hypothetical protein